MIKLNHAPTFKATVQIPMGGTVAQFKCEFRWMNDKRLAEFIARMRMLEAAESTPVKIVQSVYRLLAKIPLVKRWASPRVIVHKSAFEHLSDIIVGWEDVDMDWSEEAFNRLIELQPNALTLILGAWAKGLAENRLGN